MKRFIELRLKDAELPVGVVPKKPTNADRIRSMSDEELEEGIGRLSLGYQPWCDHHCKVNGDYNCNRCLRIWLQMPAEEADNETG